MIPLTADVDRVTPDGRVRVFETRDGGATWLGRGDGLPQSHAYLTVLRLAFGGGQAESCSLDGQQLFTAFLGQAGSSDNQSDDVVPITGTVDFPTGGDITTTCGGFNTIAADMRVTERRRSGSTVSTDRSATVQRAAITSAGVT